MLDFEGQYCTFIERLLCVNHRPRAREILRRLESLRLQILEASREFSENSQAIAKTMPHFHHETHTMSQTCIIPIHSVLAQQNALYQCLWVLPEHLINLNDEAEPTGRLKDYVGGLSSKSSLFRRFSL